MSASREELIAQREALVEELQGEWPIDVDSKSMNRKALLAAIFSMIATTVFLAVLVPVLYLTNRPKDKGADFSILEFTMYIGIFIFIVGGVFFVYIWGHAFWYRRLNPIVIDGHKLVWNKRKGFVTERLDLHNVSGVIRYDGAGSSRLVFGIINRLERSSTTSLSPVIFGSKGEHNTPKIIPSMLKDGHRFIRAIEQIAEINTQLQAIDKD